MKTRSKNKKLLLWIPVLLLNACAAYKPLPLPVRTNLQQVPHLDADAAQLSLPALRGHRFDPSDGLDMTEVAMLAVANNPALKAARDDARVAHAQAFAAGLLPDPQLGLARDIPDSHASGLTSAFNIGLNYDINALITHAAGKAAASSESRKTDLNLLWQEWQTVAQARTLFIKLLEQQKQIAVLQDSERMAQQRYDRIRLSAAQGNQTLDAVTTNLTALEDAKRQRNELTRSIGKGRQDLNELLGLAPRMTLDLVGEPALPDISSVNVREALADLPRRRPDLLALEAGYRAQDQRYRQAILGQFPSLNVGITRARDTGGIYTHGFAITLSLPLLNRNRGNVAIEQATRQKLRDEYQARLNQAASGVERILFEQELLEQQRKQIAASLTELEKAAGHAEIALQKGNIDLLAYAGLRGALLSKRMEAIANEQSLLEQRVALQALLGGEPATEGKR